MPTAVALMDGFAQRTKIGSPDGRLHRYLWTDAFAVCNFLALHRATGDLGQLSLARSLVDDVHQGLGRHRADDPRRGWISGLLEHEGRLHPTRGGLRIGKPLPERRTNEPPDERLEWERDGQYFHYLTRWMHALARIAHATREPRYLRWAIELAETTHAAFMSVDPRDGGHRLYWKMSIDLDRPLVSSMGHHDPLDALLTYLELQAASPHGALPGFARMLAEVRSIVLMTDLVTEDPLGIGGLLTGAYALAQLSVRGADCEGTSLPQLLRAATASLQWLGQCFPNGPANRRVAFRELGLAIGLRAVPRLAALVAQHRRWPEGAVTEQLVVQLRSCAPLGDSIVRFWLDPANRVASTWAEHRDINEVMLATSLVPDGHLGV